jgi:hypothetical protein
MRLTLQYSILLVATFVPTLTGLSQAAPMVAAAPAQIPAQIVEQHGVAMKTRDGVTIMSFIFGSASFC